ncbi:hypothetical protein FA95DRAFT_1460160, partial [Auriscalpium vulgare]
KIVNALTVKQELGAPMSALYILGHPDHYTMFKFKTFYWKSYVNEIKKFWSFVDSDEPREERVVLNTVEGNVVALSPVLDYMYRPREFENWPLHDWISRVHKVKISPAQKKANKGSREETFVATAQPHIEMDSDDADYIFETDNDIDDDDYDENKKKKGKRDTKIYRFLEDHPQVKTHTIRVYSEASARVPCFVGGVLPRKNHGNEENYQLTMLGLFHPWRSGADIKTPEQTWSDAFNSYDFTPRQKQIMNFCNIKYECNDARHDFAAQRRKELLENEGHPIFGRYTNELDVQHSEDLALGVPDLIAHLETEWDDIGPQTANKMAQMVQIENLMEASGWMKKSDLIPGDDLIPDFIDGGEKESSAWKTLLADKRADILNKK